MVKSPVHTPTHYFNLHLPTPPKLSWRGRFILALSLGVTAFFIGFALYVAALPTPFASVPPGLQGIAVFTGGAGRVDAALDVAAQGFSGPVLISGSHPQTKLADILSHTGSHLTLSEAQQKHIEIDGAQTTVQNIKSLKLWAESQHITRIGVITSTYHAARVTLLGRWHAPHLTLVILPVQPVNAGLPLLMHEYLKLLAAPFLR